MNLILESLSGTHTHLGGDQAGTALTCAPETPLFELVYGSNMTGTRLHAYDAILVIVEFAVLCNANADITGVLLYDAHSQEVEQVRGQ